MSVALDLCKSLCRALLALMLAFAVVSPALAEIGCNDDRIVEMSGAIGVTALSEDSSEHERLQPLRPGRSGLAARLRKGRRA
jgi:hypothetical protein